MPPSVDELRRRLESRGTDPQEAIDQRVGKAEFELTFAPRYDVTIVNDILSEAVDNTEREIVGFTSN